MKLQRIHALTGLRAVAAIMVFLYHNRKYWRNEISPFFMRFMNELHTGVTLFFVLSGFLIAYTYKDLPLQSGKAYLHYILIRMARIFPVYLILLTVKYLDDGFPAAKETFLTYSLLHGLSNVYNLKGIPQAWSLGVELSFYTVTPFMYAVLKRSIFKTILLLLLLLLLTLGMGYGWHAINGNKNYFFYPWFFVLNSTFPGRFVEFLMGMLLARYMTTTHTEEKKYRYVTLAGGLATLLCIYLLSCFAPNLYKHGTDHPAGLFIRNVVLPFFVAVFIYGLITEKTWIHRFLKWKPMILLGNASFAFYLLHIGYANLTLRSIYHFPDRNFVLLWLLSILTYLLIEKPLYGKLRKLIPSKT